jgi:hypothetical protein
MAISTSCPGCQQRLKLADHMAGKRVRCPKCQQVISVPLPEEPLPIAAVLENASQPPDVPEDEDRSDRVQSHVHEQRRRRRPLQRPRKAGFYWAVGICVGVLLLVCVTLGLGIWLLMRDLRSSSWATQQSPGASSEPAKGASPKDTKAEKVPPAKKANLESRKEVGLFRVFANQGWGFSIVAPKGWQVTRRTSNPFMVFFGPKGEFNQNFEVSKLDHDGTPIDRIGADVKRQVPRALKDWKFGDEAHLTVDGKDTYAIAGRFVLEESGKSFELVRLQYFFIRDDHTLYVLTFSVLPETYEELRGAFEEAAKSVRFEPYEKGVQPPKT